MAATFCRDGWLDGWRLGLVLTFRFFLAGPASTNALSDRLSVWFTQKLARKTCPPMHSKSDLISQRGEGVITGKLRI